MLQRLNQGTSISPFSESRGCTCAFGGWQPHFLVTTSIKYLLLCERSQLQGVTLTCCLSQATGFFIRKLVSLRAREGIGDDEGRRKEQGLGKRRGQKVQKEGGRHKEECRERWKEVEGGEEGSKGRREGEERKRGREEGNRWEGGRERGGKEEGRREGEKQ